MRVAFRNLRRTPAYTLVAATTLVLGYGVTSFNAIQRRREMGIRMALGAGPSSIVSLIVRQGLVSPAIGVATGVRWRLGSPAF